MKTYVDDRVKVLEEATNRIFSSQTEFENTISAKETNPEDLFSEVSPKNVLSGTGLAKLHAILILTTIPKEADITKFSTSTEIFLQITNGQFFKKRFDGKTELISDIKIGVISSEGRLGWYLEEIETPLLSYCYGEKGSYSTSHLCISGIKKRDGIKSEFCDSVFLRNQADTEYLSANDATFRLVVKSSLKSTNPEENLPEDIAFETAIRSFTITRIN